MQKKRVNVDRCSLSCGHSRVKIRGKKAQITVFIILGFLLLLALILLLLFKEEVIVFSPEDLVPTEKGKVENFITACISELGEEALFLIGLQGGYLVVPEDVLEDSSQHLKLSPYDVVPYWAKGESKRIPSLDEIKERLDTYIEANLQECLLRKEPFQESYDLVERSGIEANTEIVDQKVIFNVRWVVEIRDKAGEIITELIDHVAESPIKLKWAYETAKAIVEKELNEKKFEDLTIDMLSLDHPKLPLTGVEINCGKKKWKVLEAKEKLKDMLRVNVRELKVEGTVFTEFPDVLPYYQNHYVWDVGVEHPEIGVNFHYNNNFPFYFEVTPREGNTMKSGVVGGTDMLSEVCVQLWKFTYDVMYPVLVEVVDETTGFVFHTSFTVHVKRNQADRSGEVLTPSAMNIDFAGSEVYCQKKDIPITVFTRELVENNETGVYWTDPLDGVDLSFTCLKYRCEIGETEINFAGMGPGISGYRTVFPYCAGGILRGEKDGYVGGWIRMRSNKEKEVYLDLVPLFKFPGNKIKIVKHDFDDLEKVGLGNIGAGESVEAGEVVSIKIFRNKEGWGPHEETISLSLDMDEGLLEETYLEFIGKADYDYDLEIYLVGEEGIKGGYRGEWAVDWSELKLGEELVFHVLSKDKFDDEVELLDFVANLEEYSLNNSLVLEPELN